MNADDSVPDDDRLLRVAMAIADGEPVDWTDVTPGTIQSSSGDISSLAPRLQQLERIVRGHLEVHAFSEAPQETVITEARHRVPADVNVQWGPLIVRGKIGTGSFGDVYLAWDPRLEREVALKIVGDDAMPEMASSAFDEGRLLARVRHPNVVTVYGAERIGNRVGIWMEYLRGRTLAREVAERGPLPTREAALVALDVCRALAAVHSAGLLHRDVKAQNVMRDADGRVVLGDFGTVLLLDENAGVAEPRIAGTPLYLAPEVLDGRPPSAASDVYSVGVLLYFLVTGSYPVQGRTLREIRQAHASHARVPLRTARPDLPAAFVQIVDALMEPGPDRRYGTAASAAAALEEWIAEDAAPAPRSKRALALTAAVIGVLGIATLTPSVRSAVRSWAAGAFFGGGAPIARQIVDAPCIGPPSANGGHFACVERQSAFLERGGKGFAPIVLVDVETGARREVRRPQGNERFISAVLSPDGSSVAFVRLVSAAEGEQARIDVRTIGIDGRGEQLVVEPTHPVTSLGINEWAAIDNNLVVRVFRGRLPQAVALVSPALRTFEIIHEFPTLPNTFARSADGRLVAYDVPEAADRPERDIRVCDLSTGQCGTAVAHPAIDLSPAFTPDGRLLFNSDRGGTMGLWSVRLDGVRAAGVPELLQDSGRGRMAPVGFSSGGRFLYSLHYGEFDIYTATLDVAPGDQLTPVRASPRPIDVTRGPTWSPDGQRLAYMSRRGPFGGPGAMRLVIQNRGGAEREFPYDVPPNQSRLAWAPDARILALRGMLSRVFGIHLLDVETGKVLKTFRRGSPPKATVEEQISDIAWSDSRTLVYAGQDGLGSFEVESGEERRVWQAPQEQPVFGMSLSPDGLRAAVGVMEGPRPSTLLIVPLDGGAPTELLRVHAPEYLWVQSWTADGRAVLITREDSSLGWTKRREQLWSVPIDGSPPVQLPLAVAGLQDVRAHPDGKQIVFTAGGRQAEFWMTTLR